jgi:hypothetical protein
MAWTEEQKRAASERAKARWAENKTSNKNLPGENPENKQTEETPYVDPAFGDVEPEPTPEPVEPSQPNEEYGDLLRRIQEMDERHRADQQSWMQLMQQMVQNQQQNQPQGPQFGPQGMVGTRIKYIMDKSNYPDPTARLADEPRLARFAFKQNYELNYEIGVSLYATKDGYQEKQPKFTLQLIRIMFDDETGEPTNQRYVICQVIFHEDPEAAIAIANEQGFDMATIPEREFLNEMRYLRMRDWLMECFYPRRPSPSKNKKEMVIGNKVVQVFEINSEDAQAMPFDQLDRNKRL